MKNTKNNEVGNNAKNKKKPTPIKPAENSYQLADVEEPQHVVNDSGVPYVTAGSISGGEYYHNITQNITNGVKALKDLLQGAKMQVSQATTYDKIAMINHGISKKDLEYLKQKSGLDYDQLSGVLNVARATLINKKGAEKFAPSLSEKIVSLADIYSYGYEVFEDEARFNAWVFRPNKALGGKVPFDFLNNQYGREEIKNLIGRIDYGVYA